MRNLKGLPAFLIIVAVVWGLLRVAHVAIPTMNPDVIEGPFDLDELTAIEAITGFEPWIPVYHPITLGSDPVRIVAERKDERQVTMLWRDRRTLELIERASGETAVPADAQPLARPEGWFWWQRGASIHMTGRTGALAIELRTNLPREDALRIASTLVPLSEAR